MNSIKLFIVILTFFNYAQASSNLFSKEGLPISPEQGSNLKFPEDLDKTNLKIDKAGPNNPFEWSHTFATLHRDGTGGLSCTGGVVALKGFKPTDKVLFLTAGHCVSPEGKKFLPPKTVIMNSTLPQQLYLKFPRARHYSNSETGEVEQVNEVYFSKIIFASFDVIDLALLEMDFEYRQLDYVNQSPPILDFANLQNEDPIRSYGIPNADEYNSIFYHQSYCRQIEIDDMSTQINGIGDEVYILKNRHFMNCTLFPGMSGGYVRNKAGQVIGVNSGGLPGDRSFFSPVDPILACATPFGNLNLDCLIELKNKIESL